MVARSPSPKTNANAKHNSGKLTNNNSGFYQQQRPALLEATQRNIIQT
jgi:hypothetical protein